jgi:hypothetical protein
MYNITLTQNQIEERQKRLQQLCKLNTNYIVALVNANSWNETTDTRVLYFVFNREILQSYYLIALAQKDFFPNLDLWNKQKHITDEAKQKFINDRLFHFDDEMKDGLFLKFFVNLETCARLIGDKIGIKEESINKLLSKLIQVTGTNSDYQKLIQIYAFARNTMHNGGFHTKPTATVAYKGKDFDFIVSNPINFLDWNCLFFLIEETTIFFNELVSRHQISKYNVMEHSYSQITFK